jgi:hypothetical protein
MDLAALSLCCDCKMTPDPVCARSVQLHCCTATNQARIIARMPTRKPAFSDLKTWGKGDFV